MNLSVNNTQRQWQDNHRHDNGGSNYKFTNTKSPATNSSIPLKRPESPAPAPVSTAAPVVANMPALAPVPTTAPTTTPSPHTQIPAKTHKKWVSPFKKQDQAFESVIVSTIINDKLNKFSPVNYDDIRDFLNEILAAGDTDFLHDFMRLVFQKAASESVFCPLYARLLRDLSAKYPFLLDEMQILFNKFLEVFNEVNQGDCSTTEELIKRNNEKRYRKGYSQFLGELFKLDIVDHTSFMRTIECIVHEMDKLSKIPDSSNTLDEYTSCLGNIFRVINVNEGAMHVREQIAELAHTYLKPLTVSSPERPSLIPKIRMLIMNALDNLSE
jgi:hypothetical protein